MSSWDGKTLLVDSDRVVYACGYACEKRNWLVAGTSFTSKAKLTAFLEETGIAPEEVAENIELEPIQNCLHAVKVQLSGIKSRGGKDAHFFLGGKNNFRLKIDPEYKANRINNQKPVYYQEIRDYMVKQFGAEIVDNMEADDICAMLQTEDTIIVSGDKDLLQVPGWHFNPTKPDLGLQFSTPLHSARVFYESMLTGDATDNIKGLGVVPEVFVEKCGLHHSARKGCGLVSAVSLLKDCDTAEEMHQRVLDIYIEKHSGDYDNGHADFLKQGQLLYLCRDLEPETGLPLPWDGLVSPDYRTGIH